MKYLTVSANYRTTGIKDDFADELHHQNLDVSKELWDDLQRWVSSYSRIVPMEEDERRNRKEEIASLDRKGLSLMHAFQNELGREYKIRYFSEGFLRYIEE